MNKRAYIFLLDAIFAIGILLIGYVLISSQQVTENTSVPVALRAEYTMEALADARIDELCDASCNCYDAVLQSQCDDIYNAQNSLLDYLGELHYRVNEGEAGIDDYSSDLMDSVLAPLVPEGYGVSVHIDGTESYTNAMPGYQDELISSKKVIFGHYYTDAEHTVFWGPYVVELRVWI